MTEPEPGPQSEPQSEPESRSQQRGRPKVRQPYLERRREKVRTEIERNRRGEYRVPTWVFVVALVVVVVGFVSLIVFL